MARPNRRTQEGPGSVVVLVGPVSVSGVGAVVWRSLSSAGSWGVSFMAGS